MFVESISSIAPPTAEDSIPARVLPLPSPDHYWDWLLNNNSVSETQLSAHKGSVDSLSPFTQVVVASWLLQVP